LPISDDERDETLRQLLLFGLEDLMYLPDPLAKLVRVVVERHGLTPLESPLLMGSFQLIKGFWAVTKASRARW
jgi:patatin-like phospholipase/acyl hydrolase